MTIAKDSKQLARALGYFGLAILLSTALGCSSSDSPEPQTLYPFESSILGSGVSDNENWPYELLRLTNQAGDYSYAQWFPSDSVQPRGVLIIANPYRGISWSGEAVDQRWSTRTSGAKYPDDEELGYNSASSSDIVYESIAANSVADSGYLSLAKHNNLNVLVVYGRFYAGGSLWNDALDMIAGLQYVSTRTDVDQSKIGLFGVSWGAYQAIYATAYNPADINPAATLAVAPPTDFEELVTQASTIEAITQDADYTVFYEPYLRRIAASSGGTLDGAGGDFTRFTHAALASNITTPTLIIHDEWDTLIPVQQSCELSLLSDQVEAFWYQHADPEIDYNLPERKLNHGPLGVVDNTSVKTDYTWTMLYLLSKLNDSSDLILLLYDNTAMNDFFQNIHTLQLASIDVNWLLPRLTELSNERVIMFDGVCTTDCLTGSAYLANTFNNIWGTQLDGNSVVAQLDNLGIPDVSPAPAVPALKRCN